MWSRNASRKFSSTIAWTKLVEDNDEASGRGHSVVAIIRLGLFVLYALRSISPSTLAGYLHLAAIIAGINGAHVYIVLSAMK